MARLPGFVDLQVNGYGGVDFSSPDLTAEAAVYAFRLLLATGTVAFLPTVITSPLENYARNLPLLADLLSSPEFRGRVLGLHLEGPFISGEPGAVGAHNPLWARNPDPSLLLDLLEWARGSVRMITLAAELPGAGALARLAHQHGVAVSVGHSLFSESNLAELAASGATMLTHLGNGLPNELPRHANPIWAGLANDHFAALMISDGHHLPAGVIKAYVRCKGPRRLAVVSDAAPVAGLPPGSYDVMGNQAVLEPSGRLHNPTKQCLVGSSATMLDCMNFVASLDLLSEPELAMVGFWNPLRFIGLSSADIYASAYSVVYDGHRLCFGLEH